MRMLRTYQGKCLILLVGAVLLLGTLWNKRLGPALEQWRASDRSQEELLDNAHAVAELANMEARATALQRAMGDPSVPADRVWQSVLTEVADRPAVQLNGVAEEVVVPVDGNALHVLPLTLSGGFADLLRTANHLRTAVPEAKPLSIRFRTERRSFGSPPELLMTLYLQKIVDDATV